MTRASLAAPCRLERWLPRVALLGALLWPAPSHADVVPPAPSSCAPGTRPYTGHDGAGCVPEHCPLGSVGGMCNGHPCCRARVCSSSEPCAAGESCVEVRLCVTPGAFRSPPRGPVMREVISYVNEDKGCTAGDKQEIIASCLPGSSGAPTPARRGGAFGCELGAPVDLGALSPLVLALAALLARWRRARSIRI